MLKRPMISAMVVLALVSAALAAEGAKKAATESAKKPAAEGAKKSAAVGSKKAAPETAKKAAAEVAKKSSEVHSDVANRPAGSETAKRSGGGTKSVFEIPGPVTPESALDKMVFAKLAALKIEPVLCSDAVFVRRAYLDVIGTLPTADEVRAFLQDPDTKNKRRALVDRLLQRDEYADYWAMKWGDILRIKAEFPVN